MTLHNQMEEKQLHISRPLLSVRRGTSAKNPPADYKKEKNDHSQPSLPPLPYYKSDLKSGPFRNPGVVPFKWEQSPGKPKTKNRPQIEDSPKKMLPPSPKLPPRRRLNHEQQKPTNKEPSLPPLPYYKSDLKSGPFRNPGVVPFKWEQSPGKPKTKNRPQIEDSPKKMLPPSPKLPPRRRLNHEQQKPTNKEPKDSPASASKCRPEMKSPSSWELASWEKAMSVLEEPDEESKSEEVSAGSCESVKFEDARDKFSRNDSFYLNCSVSGVTGLDDPIEESSLGPRARDFMIGRFLPAAKAVASETPQFASRKHYPAPREQSKTINRTSEKTVYIDSEHMLETRSSISSSSESRGRNPSVDYSLQDIKYSQFWDHDEQAVSQSQTKNSNVFSSSSSTEDLNKSDDHNKPQYGSQSNKSCGKEMIKKQPVKPDSKALKRIPSIGLSPFLPKTPSESWLSQTLPAVSPRIPSSAWLAMNTTFRQSPTDPKRDRMLKASVVKQHMIIRPPGELAPILED